MGLSIFSNGMKPGIHLACKNTLSSLNYTLIIVSGIPILPYRQFLSKTYQYALSSVGVDDKATDLIFPDSS